MSTAYVLEFAKIRKSIGSGQRFQLLAGAQQTTGIHRSAPGARSTARRRMGAIVQGAAGGSGKDADRAKRGRSQLKASVTFLISLTGIGHPRPWPLRRNAHCRLSGAHRDVPTFAYTARCSAALTPFISNRRPRIRTYTPQWLRRTPNIAKNASSIGSQCVPQRSRTR